MCLTPILIKNPNLGLRTRYSFLKDTSSLYIKVPCGCCSECVHSRQLSLVQRCICESFTGYPFFATLTYNNESLPIYTCSNGYKIRYADFSDVVNMIKRIRKDNLFGRPFRYMAVSELGSLKARPHFHILFFVQKKPSDSVFTPYTLESKLYSTVLSQWSRNYGSKRNPDYRPLCTFIQKYRHGKINSTYDLHFVCSSVNGSTEDVPFYVTKYMLKPSDKAKRLQQALKLNLDPIEYDQVWSKVKPSWRSSLNFGFGVYGMQVKNLPLSERLSILANTESFRYIRSCIDRSISSNPYPSFYDPDSGRALPLSRYWRRFGNLFTEQDSLTFFYKNPLQYEDNVVLDSRPLDTVLRLKERFNNQLSIIDKNQFNFDLVYGKS